MKKFAALLLSSVMLLTGVCTVFGASDHVVVKSGDVFWKIARDAGLTIDELSALNPQIKNINLIYPNDKIYIVAGANKSEAAPAAKPAEEPKAAAPAAKPAEEPKAAAPAPEAPKSLYKAGSYSASAKGFGGNVEVTVTVDDSKITKVTATGASETPGIGSMAIDKLPGAIVSANSASVDTVSGATITSKAVIEAAGSAISQAKN